MKLTRSKVYISYKADIRNIKDNNGNSLSRWTIWMGASAGLDYKSRGHINNKDFSCNRLLFFFSRF